VTSSWSFILQWNTIFKPRRWY